MNACPVCHKAVQQGQQTCSFCKLNFAQWELSNASKIFSPQPFWLTPPCPKCGKYFTKRVVAEDVADMTATMRGRLSYRCQLCTELFRATPPAPQGKRSEEPMLTTRRHYVRVPVTFPVRLWAAPQQQAFTGTVTEITMGGCSVDTQAVLGQTMRVKLELSVSEGRTPFVIQQATICSIRSDGLGIEFTDLQPDEKLLLGRIMEELLASAILDCHRAVNQ